MNDTKRSRLSGNGLILFVVPIVLVLIVSFLLLTNNIVLDLSKEKMQLRSDMYADSMLLWSEQITSQLNVYKTVLEKEGGLNDHAVEIMSASYGVYDGYPFGLYWGDENKNFYDVSGWDPGPEFDPTSRGWYNEGLGHTESFEFGEPYLDLKTRKTAVGVSAKINCTDVTTVMAADVYYDYISELMEDVTRSDIDRAFVVTGKNRLIVADSDWNMTGRTLDGNIDNELYRGISALLDGGFTGMTSLSAGGSYFVNVHYIDDLDWFFVTCMDSGDMMMSLRRADMYIFIIGTAAGVILIVLTRRASVLMTAAARRAKSDPLTRLMNRDGFYSEARACLKRSPEQGVMLMFDVDNFKKVNDELGHPEGDKFLKELAALIDGYFNRNTDHCARLGGDEFAVYAERNLTGEELAVMLDKFIKLFHSTFDEKYKGQRLSVSIGASFAGDSASHTAEDIYKSADKALYKAKQDGKDRFVISGDTEKK